MLGEVAELDPFRQTISPLTGASSPANSLINVDLPRRCGLADQCASRGPDSV